MFLVVKLGNEPNGERKRRGDGIINRILTLGLNYRASRSSSTQPSAARSLQLWSAGRTHCLFVVLKACSQTGHYSPQPSTEWVCVGECVCERIGRCAPLSWKGPKISQQQICRLRNGSFLFFRRSEVFSVGPAWCKRYRRREHPPATAAGRRRNSCSVVPTG